MLKHGTTIVPKFRPSSFHSFPTTRGVTASLTRQFSTYNKHRLARTNTRTHTQNSVLLSRDIPYAVISPYYAPVRFFATNNEPDKPKTNEPEKSVVVKKEDPGGFANTMKRWESKVPFMELALPILLRFFPNLLPSTYEWKDKKDEDRAKRLRGNVEMAKFLQEAMGELSLDLKKSNAVNADEFIDFMQKVKRGEKVTNKEILIFSRLFEDELTLDKISREQLVAMHNYLHGNKSGAVRWLSADYLRTRISNKIEKIKQDDVLIQREGLDALTLDELVDASLVRGMKVEGLNRTAIVKQLRSWLDLSLNQNVPPALLVLSRAFMMSRSEPAEEALEDTLAHIPQEALEELARELPADEVERAEDRLEELTKERAMLAKKEEPKKAELKKAEPKKATEVAAEASNVKEAPEKAEHDVEIKEIQKLDTEVETLKQQSGKIMEEIGQAQNDPDAKSPQVLAKKLVNIIQGLEQEIDKMALDKEKEKEKEKPKDESKSKEEAPKSEKPKEAPTTPKEK